MKNRKIIVLLPVLISISLVFGVFLGQRMASISSASIFNGKSSIQTNKLNQVINYIKSDYVDTVQESWIVEETINGLLSKLDPHSYYIPGERFNEVNDPLEGNFDGIGVEFRIQEDSVVIVKPIPGGPSEKMGLQSGDRIVEVEGADITGTSIDNQRVMKLLKGPRGTQVNLGVKRKGVSKIVNFKIERDEIPIYSVESSYLVNDSVGYIKIIRFARTTYDEFMDAAITLQEGGMKKLILDLRNNSGGYMQAATKIADEFLKKGELIVYTEGKARERNNYLASSTGKFENLDLLVIINEGSASASEILAGALQDNDRGTITGRRSFGKGLVQEPMQWSDGSQIRLTVARYYTPTGRSIQKSYEDGIENYNDEYYDRYSSGELFSADSISFPDSLKYRTKKGKIVYGGGGIMPDIFIPIDTLGGSAFLARLNYAGVFYQFGFDYTDKHRSDLLSKFSNKDFSKKFMVNPLLLSEFYDYAQEKGVDFDAAGSEESKTIIINRIKSSIGRNLYGNSVFYEILNQEDQTLKESLRVFK